MSISRAIEEVTKTALVGPNGEALALSRASLYRWHAARDNVVMLDDVPYEMPRGQRGRRVQVFRHFLDDSFTVLHEGRHVVLAKVDLHANAVAQRTKRCAATEPTPAGKIRTAAQRAFAKDFASVVSPDGDFYDRSE